MEDPPQQVWKCPAPDYGLSGFCTLLVDLFLSDTALLCLAGDVALTKV